MSEEQIILESAGRRLLGMLHVPDGAVKAGVVVCHAFGEERKCSHRVLTLLGREMASRGTAVLRFDYAGCGDSEGELREATIATFEADIAAAVSFLRERLSPPEMGLLGVRLGAALAGRVAGRGEDIASLVLIQPILQGKAAFAADLKRKMVREMMMKGKGGGRSDLVKELETGKGEIDLDGFIITGALYRGLVEIDLLEQVGAFRGRVLIVQVAPTDAVRPEIESLRAAYEKAGAKPTILPIVEQPFWSRIEFMECRPLIEGICGRLEA